MLISQTRSASLSRLSMATTMELWAAVNKKNSCNAGSESVLLDNPDAVNVYFAKISSNDEYDSSELDRFHCKVSK